MKVITLQTILSKMKDDAQTNRGCGLFALCFLAGILLVSGTAIFSPLLLVPILLFGVPGIIMLRTSKKTKKSFEQKAIYIVTDICRNTRNESRGEDADAYILTFESGLEHTISSDDVSLTYPSAGNTDETLYIDTAPGDVFYLVYLEGAKEPTYVFPQKLCRLDTTGFVEENGVLRPRKEL